MAYPNNHARQERRPILAAIVTTCCAGAFLLISNQIILLPTLPNWYDQQRAMMLPVLAVALCALAIWPATTPRWLLLLTIAALGLSLISPRPGWALAETALFMGLTVTAYWVCQTLRSLNPRHTHGRLYGLIVYATLISLPPLIQFLVSIGSDKTEFALATLFRGFSNHRFFSQSESILVPLIALPAMLLEADSRWRKLGNVAACLLWALALAAGTRAFYVAMLVGAAFAWWGNGQTGRQWTLWQTKFAALGLLVYLLLFQALPWLLDIHITTDNARLNQLDSALNSSGRLEMWLHSIQLIATHPFTGIGPMHFATLAVQTNFASGFAAHPHNAVLQGLVEWGLQVGLSVLGLIGLGFYRLCQAGRLTTTHLTLLIQTRVLSITLVTVFVYSLLDGSIVTPYTQVLLAVVMGWAWALLPSPPPIVDDIPKRANTVNTGQAILLRLSCLATALYLIWLAWVPVHAITPHVQSYLRQYPAQTLWPRLWSQGLINLPDDQRYPSHLFHRNTP